MYQRYAIYWAGQGAFATRAAEWLGWDNALGLAVAQPEGVADWTAEPRKYGFHGTVKAPFRLAEGWDQPRLAQAFAAVCARLAPVTLDGLQIARLGSFLAMIPSGDTSALVAMAAQVVRDLDPARAALNADELARRRPQTLTPRKRALLDLWGYPHVMEEFRFHLTLSGSFPPKVLDQIEPRAAAHFGPLPAPFTLGDLCLFGEKDGRFHLIARHGLALTI
jgi:hypothetical protein